MQNHNIMLFHFIYLSYFVFMPAAVFHLSLCCFLVSVYLVVLLFPPYYKNHSDSELFCFRMNIILYYLQLRLFYSLFLYFSNSLFLYSSFSLFLFLFPTLNNHSIFESFKL
jgi:hypothetical protein